MSGITDLLSVHPVLQGLAPAFLNHIAECAHQREIPAGTQILTEGDTASHFFLIRTGKVALQTSSPSTKVETFQTLGGSDFIGVSWLAPPYRLAFDAVAMTDVSAIMFDARCLRAKCENDHALGYALMQVFVPAIIERLKCARLKALDLYAVTNP